MPNRANRFDVLDMSQSRADHHAMRREFEFPEPMAARTTPKYGRKARGINVMTVLAIGLVMLLTGVGTGIIALNVVGVLLMVGALVSAVGLARHRD